MIRHLKNHWLKYAIIGIVLLWASSGCLINTFSNNRGTFGDMFGSINSLFSGLAFLGIIYTILLQKTELALQREELRGTKEEFREQNKTMKLQRFENTLFQMISLHNEIVEKLYFDISGGNQNKGREVFKYLRDIFHRAIESDDIDRITREYNKNVQRKELDHYFRNLYHIYNFINESSLDDNEKTFYANIVTAQLSPYEIMLLLLNSLVYPKCEKITKKFNVYENINKGLVSQSLISFKDKIIN